jgi:PadR family transcriptional regulator, regulatory protein AphA
MPTRLSPTSYALLGLLDIEPFSAYELTKYMKRSALARLWPRTEASLYREPKVLVEHGFARSRVEHDGGRQRTVYRITPAGRRALRAWLDEPGDGFRFECEAAVKAFFGDAGGLDALRANLGVLRDQHHELLAAKDEVLTDWLDGRIRFPQRIQYTAMSADLIARLDRAVGEWAGDWLARIGDWERTDLHAVSEEQARSLLAESIG